MEHKRLPEGPAIELMLAYDRQRDVRELFQEYTDTIMREGEEVRACLAAQHYGEELQDLEAKYGLPSGRLYLALADGAAAGCGALARNDEVFCELKRLYVRPGHRGEHIGQALLERLIADAREIGYRYVRLDTFPFMGPAVRLYEKYGFRPVERYNDNPAKDAVFLQLDLSRP